MERMEEIIVEFFKCSLANNFDEFDWDEAFDEFIPHLKRNCDEHGQGTFEDFCELFYEYYDQSSIECDIPEWAKYDTRWGSLDESDLVEALLRCKYNFFRELFENNVHGDNAELLERAQNHSSIKSLPELISLFDECIHAQHATGNILEDVDPDELREKAEEEFEEEKENHVTNIRCFL